MTGRRDTEDDLRATAESVSTDAERLASLEAAKLTLEPDDPRIQALSREASALGESLARNTSAEEAISGELTDGRD